MLRSNSMLLTGLDPYIQVRRRPASGRFTTLDERYTDSYRSPESQPTTDRTSLERLLHQDEMLEFA